jgi:DNA-binding NtrC family response regulator
MAKPGILLVNGDFTVQHLRALMLRMRGYDVDTASTLEEARTALSKKNYCLLIVDVGHFAKPGLDFCEEIKQQYPQQKVVMQMDYHLFLDGSSCPDKVISKEDGPQHFLNEVEAVLESAG